MRLLILSLLLSDLTTVEFFSLSNSQILGKAIAEVKESTKVEVKKKIAVFKKAIKKLRTSKQREYKAHFKGKGTSVGKVSPQVKEAEWEKDLRSE